MTAGCDDGDTRTHFIEHGGPLSARFTYVSPAASISKRQQLQCTWWMWLLRERGDFDGARKLLAAFSKPPPTATQ